MGECRPVGHSSDSGGEGLGRTRENDLLAVIKCSAGSNHQNEDPHKSTNRHRFHNKRTFVGFARISNIWRQMPIRESSNLDSQPTLIKRHARCPRNQDLAGQNNRVFILGLSTKRAMAIYRGDQNP